MWPKFAETRKSELINIRRNLYRGNGEVARGRKLPLFLDDGQLRASIKQFQQVELLIVNKRHNPPVVIGGNGRLQAMLADGYTHAAVCFVDLDDAKANALSLSLNRTADGRTWEAEALAELLKDVNTGCDPRLDEMLADLAKELKLTPAEEAAAKPDAPADEPPVAGKFAIMIECTDEAAQVALLERFTQEGMVCRSLII